MTSMRNRMGASSGYRTSRRPSTSLRPRLRERPMSFCLASIIARRLCACGFRGYVQVYNRQRAQDDRHRQTSAGDPGWQDQRGSKMMLPPTSVLAAPRWLNLGCRRRQENGWVTLYIARRQPRMDSGDPAPFSTFQRTGASAPPAAQLEHWRSRCDFLSEPATRLFRRRAR
jgi:hypothetical protein